MPHRDLYAAIDLGSNSFHMLVARREHGQLRVIDRLKEMVRIAGGLDRGGRLDRQTRQDALDCLARFGQRIAGIPPEHVRAVGTQSFRRMRNALGFLVVAETALGCPIDIISGREEARLVYLGVSEGTGSQDGRRLVIDIGGGSTELVVGEGPDPIVAESIAYGCVGVTRAAFGKGMITGKRWKRAAAEVASDLQELLARLRDSEWTHAVGSSGTIRAVQSIISARTGAPPRAITLEDVSQLRSVLVAAGHIDRVDLPGLSSRRQPVIAGGVLVLEVCMQAVGIEELEVSPYALREGLLQDLVGRLEESDPRDRTVSAMAGLHEVDRAQAERVRDFCLCALDQTDEALGLGPAHRDLLDWACRLHEVGLVIAHGQYAAHSAYIVRHSDMAGFTQQEQLFMALLLGSQRGKLVPDWTAELPARLHAPARNLLILLRLGILLCRARSDSDLPDFAIHAPSRNRIVLSLPSGWLDSHPLSARDIELERRELSRIGVALQLKVLDQPHPVEP